MSLSSEHSAPRTAQRLFGDMRKSKSKNNLKCRCAHPHCRKEGAFPAPRAEQYLQQELQEGRQARTWLCLEHAREANSAWNVFAGLSDAEVERAVRAAAVGDRPTWPINAYARRSEENTAEVDGTENPSPDSTHTFWQNSLHDPLDDSLRRFRDIASARRNPRNSTRDPTRNSTRDPTRDIWAAKTGEAREASVAAAKWRHPRTRAQREACRVMALTPPICAQQLKERYRALAKAHHPDQHLAQKKQAEKQEQFKRINAAYALLQELCQQALCQHASSSGRQA